MVRLWTPRRQPRVCRIPPTPQLHIRPTRRPRLLPLKNVPKRVAKMPAVLDRLRRRPRRPQAPRQHLAKDERRAVLDPADLPFGVGVAVGQTNQQMAVTPADRDCQQPQVAAGRRFPQCLDDPRATLDRDQDLARTISLCGVEEVRVFAQRRGAAVVAGGVLVVTSAVEAARVAGEPTAVRAEADVPPGGGVGGHAREDARLRGCSQVTSKRFTHDGPAAFAAASRTGGARLGRRGGSRGSDLRT